MEEHGERHKMLGGELYFPHDPHLVALRQRAKTLCYEYNSSNDVVRRLDILTSLCGKLGKGVEVEPPFYCDYGENIIAGDMLYMNHGCLILDGNRVTLGNHVYMGPGVHIYTINHPLDALTRSRGLERAAPVTIGDHVWLGGRVTVCPGVSIGHGSVIGAGSVVVKDVPAGVLAVGNPCRVVRRL